MQRLLALVLLGLCLTLPARAQELRDILAFYKTPTGAKALRVMPKVMADVGATLAPHMPAFQRDMGGRLDAIMQKHGYKN